MHIASILSVILVALGCMDLISASAVGFDCKCTCCVKPNARKECKPMELGSVKLYQTVCAEKQCMDACKTEYHLCESAKATIQAECIKSPGPDDTSVAPTTMTSSTMSSTVTVITTTTSVSTAAPTTTSMSTAAPTTTSISTAVPTTTSMSTAAPTTPTPWPTTSTESTKSTASPATTTTQTSPTVTTTTQTGPTVTTTSQPGPGTSTKSSGNALKSVFSHFVLFSVVITFFYL